MGHKLRVNNSLIEEEWTGFIDSPKIRAASGVLTGQARLEHNTPSGAGRRSTVGDGMLVG